MARDDSVGSRADDGECRLAWTLHVELATRVSTVGLDADRGLLSEAVDSLRALFAVARDALAGHPDVAASDSARTVVTVLDEVLRPFLTTWHPLLVAHEQRRPAGVGGLEHERGWQHDTAMRAELAELQVVLRGLARHLAQRAGARSLVPDEPLVVGR